MTPNRYTATVTFRGYGATADELAGRILRALSTHPTLSFRVDDVQVEVHKPEPEPDLPPQALADQ